MTLGCPQSAEFCKKSLLDFHSVIREDKHHDGAKRAEIL